MDYPPAVEALLAKAEARIGDRVRASKAGAVYEGTVMPHHGFSGEDILTLKLDSGYNVGVAVAGTRLELLAHGAEVAHARHAPVADSSLPVVAFLGTGGTIASFVDYRTGAVHPAVTAEDLVFSVPELAAVCQPRARKLLSLYSENLKPEHWSLLAREAAAELNAGAAGVVIPHGTDTLGYSAAAVSFLLRDLPGPVVFVGSQRSSDRPSSDAALNLLCATRTALTDLGEVVAVMHEGTGDEACTIHRGTKVRKLHTSRRDAFRSVNVPPVGRATASEVVLSGARPRVKGPARLEGALDANVALVHFHPGLTAEDLAHTLQTHKGTVIAGTGLGHVAFDLVPPIRAAITEGKTVVMTSQCLYGRVDLEVYDSGRDLLAAGAVAGSDMLPETALAKLMWALGTYATPAEVRSALERDVAGEITARIGLGSAAPQRPHPDI